MTQVPVTSKYSQMLYINLGFVYSSFTLIASGRTTHAVGIVVTVPRPGNT